ncbi:MAG: hypothetical protein AAF969_17245 [Bacteroidota bacterium]
MNILIVYNFCDDKTYEVLKTVINKFKGQLIYHSTSTFWLECEQSLVYTLLTDIYLAFKGPKILNRSDSIEAFYVNAISSDLSIVRLKKKNNKTMRKVEFEFLNPNLL